MLDNIIDSPLFSNMVQEVGEKISTQDVENTDKPQNLEETLNNSLLNVFSSFFNFCH